MTPQFVTYTAYLEGSLSLTAEGEWLHDGSPFQNQNVAELFHRSVRWNQEAGRYELQIGKEVATFTVADTPYFVKEIRSIQREPEVVLLGGHCERLNIQSLSLGSSDQLYCLVNGSHRARLLRSAHQELLRYTIDDSTLLVAGQRVQLTPRPNEV